MLKKLFEPLAMKVAGGLIAALLVLGGVLYVQNRSLRAVNADLSGKLALEEAKHAITLNSLSQLERRLSDMIAAGKLTRERVERAIETGGNESAALREQAEEARGAIVIDGRTPKAILESGL